MESCFEPPDSPFVNKRVLEIENKNQEPYSFVKETKVLPLLDEKTD